MLSIVLWILQIGLAVFCMSGGYFQMFKVEQLRLHSASMREMPRAAWALLGAIGFLSGLALIIPGLLHVMPMVTACAALVVVAESVVLTACFVHYHDRASVPYPIVMGIVAVIIAYGRFVLRPL